MLKDIGLNIMMVLFTQLVLLLPGILQVNLELQEWVVLLQLIFIVLDGFLMVVILHLEQGMHVLIWIWAGFLEIHML